jgi:hypothetical protein
MPAAAADLILKRFRATLDTVYGDRIERVVLFGSRAHGVRRVSRFGLVFLRGFGAFSFSGRSSPCRGVRRARGLADRGEIVPGKRADLVRARLVDGIPVARQVGRAGERVA